ncbi:uncharacterized protein LOC141874427 isoform X1 [Acropora palmata]|uniref:uncharacterized protein LOC141874427 isoform X1 n=1 Tax=Acropora palmata TaxID=6131 RepID=UPI003DA04366
MTSHSRCAKDSASCDTKFCLLREHGVLADVLLKKFPSCCCFLGFAIKCQICSSTTSMEDCKKNEKERDCGGGFDRCFKSSFAYKVSILETKAFAKGCATKAFCDAEETLKICKKAKGSTCAFNCCDSDGCNSSAMPVISAFLLVICTLVSKMCY